MKQTRNDYKLDDFLQTGTYEKFGKTHTQKFFDFHKIAAAGYFITLIISERWSKGKTYNAKAFIADEYLKKGYRSLWLRNLVGDVERERATFLDAVPSTYDGAKFYGRADKNTMGLGWGDEDETTANMGIKFLSMNSAESFKGSRTWYRYVVWDEFNVNDDKVRNLMDKFASLQETTNDALYGSDDAHMQQWFIFGNNKSLASPIIVNLGVCEIQQEITTYEMSGFKMLLVIMVASDNTITNLLEEHPNPKYLLAKQMDYDQHAYGNASLYDEVNSVYPITKTSFEWMYDLVYCFIKVDGYCLEIRYMLRKNDKIAVIESIKSNLANNPKALNILNTSQDALRLNVIKQYWVRAYKDKEVSMDNDVIKLYATNNDKTEGWKKITRNVQDHLLMCLYHNNITFEDVWSRALLFKCIK